VIALMLFDFGFGGLFLCLSASRLGSGFNIAGDLADRRKKNLPH
jgi:hypothetical protein